MKPVAMLTLTAVQSDSYPMYVYGYTRSHTHVLLW